MQNLVFSCIISYTVPPGNVKCYYIQPGRNIGYKSNVNLPTLRQVIRFSKSGSSVCSTTQDNGSDPSRRPKTMLLQKRQTERYSGQAASVIMKCIEKLVKDHITSTLPDTLDPLQFAYRPNRSTDDAFAITLHIALTHLDKRNTYVKMLFIDQHLTP